MSTTPDLSQFFLPARIERIDSVVANRTKSLTLVLDRVHHPHNIAAVLRSADAFGLCDIHLIGENYDHNRAISKGTERWVTVHRHANVQSILKQLIDDEFELVIIEAADIGNPNTSVPVYELPFERKLALVFGNEHDGVAAEIRSFPHRRAHIPMLGFVESLNISVAVAVTLFTSMVSGVVPRRRVAPLDAEESQSLRTEYLEMLQANRIQERK